MEVTTTSEKVLEAAGKCGEAKRTLEILFPQVFEQSSFWREHGIYRHKDGEHYKLASISSGKYQLVGVDSRFYSGPSVVNFDALDWKKTEFTYIGQVQDVVKVTPREG